MCVSRSKSSWARFWRLVTVARYEPCRGLQCIAGNVIARMGGGMDSTIEEEGPLDRCDPHGTEKKNGECRKNSAEKRRRDPKFNGEALLKLPQRCGCARRGMPMFGWPAARGCNFWPRLVYGPDLMLGLFANQSRAVGYSGTFFYGGRSLACPALGGIAQTALPSDGKSAENLFAALSSA